MSTKRSTSLAKMAASTQCRVISASVDNAEIQSRLYALGVYPGVMLDVLRFAPTGDPIQIKIGGTLLSIRKSEAQLIQVDEQSVATLPEDQSQ